MSLERVIIWGRWGAADPGEGSGQVSCPSVLDRELCGDGAGVHSTLSPLFHFLVLISWKEVSVSPLEALPVEKGH